jgi:hypothetical protein
MWHFPPPLSLSLAEPFPQKSHSEMAMHGYANVVQLRCTRLLPAPHHLSLVLGKAKVIRLGRVARGSGNPI